MGVHVDKARSDDSSGNIDDLRGLDFDSWLNLDEFSPVYENIQGLISLRGWVYHPSILKQQAHALSLPIRDKG